jgi:hypothetical protein
MASHAFFFFATPTQNLTGTLRTAKKRGFVMYHAEMLLSGVHDSITITLQADDIPASDLDTCVYL